MDPSQAIAFNLSRLRGGPPTSELVRRQVLGLHQRRSQLRVEVDGLERRRRHMRGRLEALAREIADWHHRSAVAEQGGRPELAVEARSRAELCERERDGLSREVHRCEGLIERARPRLDAVSEALNGFLRKGPRGAETLPTLTPGLLPEVGPDSLRAAFERIEAEIAWGDEVREVSRRASESDRHRSGSL